MSRRFRDESALSRIARLSRLPSSSPPLLLLPRSPMHGPAPEREQRASGASEVRRVADTEATAPGELMVVRPWHKSSRTNPVQQLAERHILKFARQRVGECKRQLLSIK